MHVYCFNFVGKSHKYNRPKFGDGDFLVSGATGRNRM